MNYRFCEDIPLISRKEITVVCCVALLEDTMHSMCPERNFTSLQNISSICLYKKCILLPGINSIPKPPPQHMLLNTLKLVASAYFVLRLENGYS